MTNGPLDGRSPGLSRVAWALQYPVAPREGSLEHVKIGRVSGTAIDNVFCADFRTRDRRRATNRPRLLPGSGCRCDIVNKFGAGDDGFDPYRSLPALTHGSKGRSIDRSCWLPYIEVKLAKMGTTASSESISSPRPAPDGRLVVCAILPASTTS